jgi:hypothetical protein
MLIIKKIKKNAKCIAKVVGYGLATIGATAVEIAGSIQVMNKIVEGCDEDNPANFIQTLGVVGTAIGASAAETATMLGGIGLIENEIENNWK